MHKKFHDSIAGYLKLKFKSLHKCFQENLHLKTVLFSELSKFYKNNSTKSNSNYKYLRKSESLGQKTVQFLFKGTIQIW